MRIFVAIPHYFGPAQPDNSSPAIGSYIEPLGRIAALNETIVSLHRHFGPVRHTLEGVDIPHDQSESCVLDIVVVTTRDHNVIADIGLAPGTIEVEYVDDKPSHIPFHVQRLIRDRLGAYDFYCYLEDDLVIHDAAFFAKLRWFQDTFGPRALLAPVRFEMSSVGDLAKVVIDPVLPDGHLAPFRRAGQAATIEGIWNGRRQTFQLPVNPHAASFFVNQDQLAYWARQPSFDDRDSSWMGPIESAATLSVGKVFDIYKPTEPDPFFLEIQHYGTRYASVRPPQGRRYGEQPLLAIAQNAVHAFLEESGASPDALWADSGLSPLVQRWLAKGTAAEQVGRLRGLLAKARAKSEKP